jgi:hypothetical protein
MSVTAVPLKSDVPSTLFERGLESMRAYTLHAVVLTFALALLASAALPRSVTAQVSGAAPVFLAMPDVYPDIDGRIVLLREPGREVIVLSQAATPEDLTMAVRMLARFRRQRGQPEARRGEMIPIVGYAPAPVLSGMERARLQSVLTELKARPPASVGSLGSGRWMRWDPR